MYLCNALVCHKHSAFSLSILEYIDISGLSKEEARELILAREQCYLDFMFEADEPKTYNILKVAGSSLGFKHSEETITKMSEAQKSVERSDENNPMFGKSHSAEIIAKMSGEFNPMFGKTGESHPMFGKSHNTETKSKISEAHIGVPKTEEHKAKISKSMKKKVFVYSSSTPIILKYEFDSYSEATEHFSCSPKTIVKYLKSGTVFRGEWILSSSKKEI
jgi:group I intron endonuclease